VSTDKTPKFTATAILPTRETVCVEARSKYP